MGSAASAAAASPTFANRTTVDGLGSDIVEAVAVDGSTVYAGTDGGLSISIDGDTTFANYTTAQGLGSNTVLGVVVDGSTVYAATGGGLSISTDEGGAPTSESTPPTTFTFTFNTSTGGECFTDVAVTAGAYRAPASTVSCIPAGTELVGWSIPGQSTSFSDGGK